MATQCDYLIFDISNLLYRNFFANRGESEDTTAGLAVHTALTMLNKYFRKYTPRKKVVMAFDRKSWRKEYTASDQCISKKPYKGNRRQDMTPAQQEKYARFMNHMKEFETMIDQHTTIVTLYADQLEADDVIAGFCQIIASPENEITIISTDSDLLQLSRYDNVEVISPATDERQSLAEYDGDALYYVFQKCIRGDSTDNVQAAYPRVRSARIRKAWTDPFERVQLMKERWTNENKIEFVVEHLYEENQKLIDLSKQPAEIRKLIFETVDAALERPRTFSMFFILKFIGKYKLMKIKESIDQYIPLLSR